MRIDAGPDPRQRSDRPAGAERETTMKTNYMTAASQTSTRRNNAQILRERLYATRDTDAWNERELLELVLTYTASKDPAATADALTDQFTNLAGVLEARPEQLATVPGMSARSAALIAALLPVMRAYERQKLAKPRRIGNSTEAETFCRSLLRGQRLEEFHVIALNAQCNVLGERKISQGSIGECAAYPRIVVETALNYNAHSVIFTHNHPGGTCAPSAEDIQSTQQLQRTLASIGILLLDHIIVAGEATYSMVREGDISYRTR